MSHKHDVNTYVAIRWYVNKIENLAISTYAGYPDRKDDIMSYLKGVAMSLDLLSRGPGRPPLAETDSQLATRGLEVAGGGEMDPDPDCPWDICANGSCRPSCTIAPK